MTALMRLAAVIAICALASRNSYAQSGPYQVVNVGGRQASCPVGAFIVPVFVGPIPGNDLAFSTIINGNPVILLNPQGVNMPFPIQLFMFAHECEHHRLGHLIGQRPPTFETDADCEAIKRLKALGWVIGNTPK